MVPSRRSGRALFTKAPLGLSPEGADNAVAVIVGAARPIVCGRSILIPGKNVSTFLPVGNAECISERHKSKIYDGICITGLLYVPLIRGPSSFREKKQKRRPAGREKEEE